MAILLVPRSLTGDISQKTSIAIHSPNSFFFTQHDVDHPDTHPLGYA